ncbi:hypothetical protein BASU183_18115 [Bacillus subtilis]
MNQDIQFLKELQQELKYQDSDGQASPRFWTVGDYEWVEAREENAERYSVYLPAGMIQRLLTSGFRKLGFSASVGTSINHIVADLFIFSPRRDKAPSKLAQTVIGSIVNDCQDVL